MLIKEAFAKFLEDPSRDKLREVFKLHTGEEDFLDFKKKWPANAKLAKHILAFSNSGGGCLIVGVGQSNDGTIEVTGIDKIEDKVEINNGVKKYLPQHLDFELQDFQFDDSEYGKLIGKKFQVLWVKDDPHHLPYVSNYEGDQLRRGAIYVREGTESVEGTYERVQKILNRRIETEYSTTEEFELQDHLTQLKILYGEIPRFKNKYSSGLVASLSSAKDFFPGIRETVPPLMSFNPLFPEENYEEFIVRMIKVKKERIEKIVTGNGQYKK